MQNKYKKRVFVVLKSTRLFWILIWFVLFPACHKNSNQESKSKDSVPIFKAEKGMEKEFAHIVVPEKLNSLHKDDFPWGGVVSHHGVTAKLLDDYFCTLSKTRNVKNFYILSPSHFGFSKYYASLTTGSWETEYGIVESNALTTKNLCEALGVPLDDKPFYIEHGVWTLLPFVKKYFPDAKVTAILYDVVNSFSGAKIKNFAEIISAHFIQNGHPDNDENFFLVSADFSHYANLETTLTRDKRSAEFFLQPKVVSPWQVTCDNTPAILTFQKLATNKTKVITIYQTHCLFILPYETDPNDITSYFFSFFCDEQSIH